ncbi:MAG: DUF1016 domain-containing protein [Chlorobium sp.]|nr:MAG: DUF1016 domain-containing protein [Chlorobium sp.]
MISQQLVGQLPWSATVIPSLSKDIPNALPEIKGFSERNIRYMICFASSNTGASILQQAVAKLPGRALLAGIPGGIPKNICLNLVPFFPLSASNRNLPGR